MIISGSHSGSPERIEAQMWVRHAGYANATPSGLNLNLRGMWAALDFDSTPTETRDVPLGQACVIGFANGVALGYLQTVLGIVSSNLIVGVDCSASSYKVAQWVNIQTYGHCDRIVVVVNGGLDWKYIVPELGTEDGANFGVTAAAGIAASTLSGIFTFDGAPGAGETINLDGTTTAAGSWNAAPTVATPTGTPTPQMRVLGWYYDGGAETLLDENSRLDATYQAIFRQRKGFLSCMGLSIR